MAGFARTWSCGRMFRILRREGTGIAEPHVLVVCNSPAVNPQTVSALSVTASLVACADGGANKYARAASRPPDLVVGDFDSIDAGLLTSLRLDPRVRCVHEPDQSRDDLQKTLANLHVEMENRGVDKDSYVVVVGALGGNLSQELANFNSLYHFTFLRTVFLGTRNLAFMLQPGQNQIVLETLTDRDVKGAHCGLIPIGGPAASVTTTGLKWNLTKDKMGFGGLISSSNELISSTVDVETTDSLLFILDARYQPAH